MDELDLRIRNRVYASFVRDGTASGPAEVAAELGLAERRSETPIVGSTTRTRSCSTRAPGGSGC